MITMRCCVRAGQGALQGKLGDHRRTVTTLWGYILDRSDSVPLLLTVCHVMGDWILMPKTTINPKEKNTCLQKMEALDRINEVSAQPLINYFQRLCLQMHATGVAGNGGAPDTPGSQAAATAPSAKPVWLSNPAMLKPYTTGLMSADPSLRAEFFNQLYSTMTKSPGQRVMQVIKQDWEPLNQRFYVVVMAEVMIAALRTTTPAQIEPGAKTIEAISTRPFSPSDVEHHHPNRESAVTAHEAFIQKIVETRTTNCVSMVESLRLLMHLDMSLSNCLWQVLVQSSWATVSESQQNGMHQHLVNLLVKYLHRQSLFIPSSLTALNQGAPQNTIQSLLQGFLRPKVPFLPCDLLGALAIHYNAWFHVLPLVESSVFYNPPPSMAGLATSFSSDKHGWIQVLEEIYSRLNEQDLKAALKRR